MKEPYYQLERNFSQHCGTHTVVCSSGTAALHLALEALQLPPGSQVLVPEFTMIACARAVTMAGLKPVFVDCTDDLLMDETKLVDLVCEKTSAIMPVHIYGRQCPMVLIRALSRKYNLRIIEDCAECPTAGFPLDTRTDAACWSFYKNKIIAGEEGGAVAFLSEDVAHRARQLRSQGFTSDHNFIHVPRGMNYRLSNANAKPVLESLAQLDENLAKRAQVERWYDERIPGGWKMPPRRDVWVYDIKDNRGYKLVPMLNDRSVAARFAFRPMSEQPEYRSTYKHLNAHKMSGSVFYLPVYPSMDEGYVNTVCSALLPCPTT